MKFFTVLLFGFLSGIGAHHLYYTLYKPSYQDTVASELAWIRHEFRLSEEQFGAIQSVHQEYGQSFELFLAELADTYQTKLVFEDQRRKTSVVDFLAFFQILERERKIKNDSRKSTLDLVEAVSSVMTPEQRIGYYALVDECIDNYQDERKLLESNN